MLRILPADPTLRILPALLMLRMLNILPKLRMLPKLAILRYESFDGAVKMRDSDRPLSPSMLLVPERERSILD